MNALIAAGELLVFLIAALVIGVMELFGGNDAP